MSITSIARNCKNAETFWFSSPVGLDHIVLHPHHNRNGPAFLVSPDTKEKLFCRRWLCHCFICEWPPLQVRMARRLQIAKMIL